MVSGKPLAEGGRRTARIRKSPELAAEAFAQGLPVARKAQDLMPKPVVPAWIDLLLDEHGWEQRAKPGNPEILEERVAFGSGQESRQLKRENHQPEVPGRVSGRAGFGFMKTRISNAEHSYCASTYA